MALIGEALRTYCLTKTGITNIIGQRFYPGNVPQAITLPAAVYVVITGVRTGSLLGSSGLVRHEMQIDSLALEYSQVVLLAEQFRLALDGYRGLWGASFVVEGVVNYSDRDGNYEDETTVNRVISEFGVWHSEPRANQIITS